MAKDFGELSRVDAHATIPEIRGAGFICKGVRTQTPFATSSWRSEQLLRHGTLRFLARKPRQTQSGAPSPSRNRNTGYGSSARTPAGVTRSSRPRSCYSDCSGSESWSMLSGSCLSFLGRTLYDGT
jgi:hypothetical protein